MKQEGTHVVSILPERCPQPAGHIAVLMAFSDDEDIVLWLFPDFTTAHGRILKTNVGNGNWNITVFPHGLQG